MSDENNTGLFSLLRLAKDASPDVVNEAAQNLTNFINDHHENEVSPLDYLISKL